MQSKPLSALLVFDPPGSQPSEHRPPAQEIVDVRAALAAPDWQLDEVAGLAAAASFLQTGKVDLVVADLSSSGIRPLDAVQIIRNGSPEAAIVVFSGGRDEPLVLETLREGAQDYLIRGEENRRGIARCFRYAIERQRVQIGLMELAKRLEAANQSLQKLSMIDGLTGIANRRLFDQALLAEWRRAARAQAPLSLLLLDIDHFKLFNDSVGHLQGDYCLQQVAAALAEAVKRAGDLVARYGGEEFALILPNTDLIKSPNVAENIRQAIIERKIPHPASPVAKHITVSGGGWTLLPTATNTPEDLIAKADQLLYRAKQFGRDRILTGTDIPGAD